MTDLTPPTAGELDELERWSPLMLDMSPYAGKKVMTHIPQETWLALIAMARRSLAFDALAAEFAILETWLHQNGAHRSHYAGASLRCSLCEAMVRGRAILDGKPSPIQGPPLEYRSSWWQPTHRHYKGGLYMVLHADAQHSETGDHLTIYQHMNGSVWARPSAMFNGMVQTNAPGGRSMQVRRFEPVPASPSPPVPAPVPEPVRAGLVEALTEARHKGLIYWEPNTERGHVAKALMFVKIDAALQAAGEKE